MGINIRQKGAEGEREVVRLLNGIIAQVMMELGYSLAEIGNQLQDVQRNQNQSAVGGCDLSNTFGIAIEVKRQEQLSVNSWWAQCKASADKLNELPLLIYRQNRKPWRIRTYAWLPMPANSEGMYDRQLRAVVDFELEVFKEWFAAWVRAKLIFDKA